MCVWVREWVKHQHDSYITTRSRVCVRVCIFTYVCVYMRLRLAWSHPQQKCGMDKYPGTRVQPRKKGKKKWCHSKNLRHTCLQAQGLAARICNVFIKTPKRIYIYNVYRPRKLYIHNLYNSMSWSGELRWLCHWWDNLQWLFTQINNEESMWVSHDVCINFEDTETVFDACIQTPKIAKTPN